MGLPNIRAVTPNVPVGALKFFVRVGQCGDSAGIIFGREIGDSVGYPAKLFRSLRQRCRR